MHTPSDNIHISIINLQALEKYTYEQSLEHTSQFIEKLEKELEEYHKHLDRYRKRKEEGNAPQVSVNT